MKNSRSKIIIALSFLVAIGIAYYAGLQQSPDQTNYSAPPAARGSATVPDPAVRSQLATATAINPEANFTHFRVGESNVKTILADGKILWIGTSGGVIRYDSGNDAHQVFDVKSGLLANGIFHLSKINNELFVGTYGGGLSIQNKAMDGWRTYNIPEGIADAFIYDVLQADNNDLWIATWSGANRIRNSELDNPDQWDTFTVENTDGGLPNDWVYGMEKGIDGSIWFATEGGVAHYKDGKWENWQHEDGLGADYEVVRNDAQIENDPSTISVHHARQKLEYGLTGIDVAYNPNYVVALLVDQEGIVWVGTWGGGLARFDGNKWTNYTVADGLPSNHVFTLYQDPGGRIWIGTANGLARKDGDSYKVYTTHDGLFANNIFSMTSAEDGSYWIGSYGGVTRMRSLP